MNDCDVGMLGIFMASAAIIPLINCGEIQRVNSIFARLKQLKLILFLEFLYLGLF